MSSKASPGAPATLSERKRVAIVQAAVDAFREQGFHATSMDHVADRAGVSKRTLYNHFASKDALFDVVTEQFWSRLIAAPAGFAQAQGKSASLPVEERLCAFALARLAVLLDPEVLGIFRVVLAESVRFPDLARAWHFEAPHLHVIGLYALIAEEAAAGRLVVDDVTVAATHLWGLAIDSLLWPAVLLMHARVPGPERERVVADGIKTFMARYGVAKAAPPAVKAARLRPAKSVRHKRGTK